jgi:AmmeMemoRadiSam system protein A
VEIPSHGLISADQRRYLLELARGSIAERLGVGSPPGCDRPPGLEGLQGAFVTLKIDGRLRGCIGHVVGVSPLWEAVRDNAIAAAFRDPRFPELTADELPGARLEISVLSPLQSVEADEIDVGRHGLLLEQGAARGLLLPQVAVEYGWDRETFLDHTCRKAGLASGCWRHPDTVIQVFSAEVFGEDGV